MAITTIKQLPAFEHDERMRQRQHNEEQRSIWARCATLLRDESAERRDAERTAVLGYN